MKKYIPYESNIYTNIICVNVSSAAFMADEIIPANTLMLKRIRNQFFPKSHNPFQMSFKKL